MAKRGGSWPRYAWKSGVSSVTCVQVAVGPDAEIPASATYTSTMATPDGLFMIVQISDLHCGTQFFLPNMLERAITEVNDLEPDIVVVSGDLTTFGFKESTRLPRATSTRSSARPWSSSPKPRSRNVGYVHFEELFGDRSTVVRVGGVTVVAVDSTEPDLDHGVIRPRPLSVDRGMLRAAGRLARVRVAINHLLPVPGTGGAERLYDAGDAIECLQRRVSISSFRDISTSPYAWRLEDLFIVNAGDGLVHCAYGERLGPVTT